MALNTNIYGFVIDPLFSFCDQGGKTIANGYVRVFRAGTSTPVLTYRNYDGAFNAETIELDNSGRTMTQVIASKGDLYKVCVYDANHSQEDPILTVDKVAVIGASVNATNIVQGLNDVEGSGWIKSVAADDTAEVSLDATNVTSEVDTMVKATAASADYMMPLVHKTGSDPDKKITLGNIFKFVLNFIHSLTDTATESDIASGNYFALDGSAGTKKLNSTTLLTKTAQNALAGNVAPAFDPTRTSENPYKAGESVAYEGKTYTFKVDHYGAWSAADVERGPISEKVDAGFLIGKKILCFGDSITQFTYEGKSYTDYLRDKSLASVTNVGIGGTSISPVSTSVVTPSSEMESFSNLSMYYIIDAWLNNDWTNVDAAVDWLYVNTQRNFSSIIERLKNTDIQDVDVITILGGTNDFGYSVPSGNVGDISYMSTVGALGLIIDKLLAAKPSVKIYVFTPIVRWFGDGTDPDDFSDVYVRNAITLKELVGKIKQECAYKHTPVCDLYNNLGWNTTNFYEYFINNGTHPYGGFEILADKIFSFLKAPNESSVDESFVEKKLNSTADKLSKAVLLHGYYTTNGNVLSDFTASESYRCAVVYGNVGDKLYVQGQGSSGARLWATIDKYNVIKRKADVNADSSASPTEITLAAGEVGIVFNSNYNSGLSDKVACFLDSSITDTASSLSIAVHNNTRRIEAERAVVLEEGYRTTNGDYLASLTASAGYRSAIAYGYEGDSFVVAGRGTSAARTWATIDYSGKIIRRANSDLDSIQSPVTVTLGSGEVGIVINSAYSDSWYYRLVRLEVNSTLGSDLQKSMKKIASLENAESAESANENIVKIPDGFQNTFVFPYSSKFNIRAKFVIKDNPYKFATTAQYFFRWKRGAVLGGIAIKAETLTQKTSTFVDDNSQTQTSYQPYFNKGVAINNSSYLDISNKFLGNIAFGIQYVGNGSAASFECDGEKIILKKGGVATNYAFSTYATMGALFNAIAEDADFVVDYKELENHTPDELAFYGETQLVSQYKRDIGNGSEEIYTDNPMIYVRYGTSGKYHQLEIFCDGEKIHRCVDGYLYSENLSTYSQDGDWQVYVTDPNNQFEFTDIEICINGVRDAEIVKYSDTRDKMISSVNPCIIVYEGHGIYDAASVNSGAAPEGGLDTTPDRLAAVFDLLRKKGYVSVPLSKIIGYLDEQNELPKRCYTLMFDDYRFDNVMDLKKRSAFTANGVYANLAVISSQDSPIVIDGETITLKDAVNICRNAKFECYSHTRSHRYMTHCKYSDYANEITEDVYDGDKKGINGNVIIYPYGNSDEYIFEVMDYLGISAGINIVSVSGYSSCRWISKHYITRLEIGMRESMADIIKSIV